MYDGDIPKKRSSPVATVGVGPICASLGAAEAHMACSDVVSYSRLAGADEETRKLAAILRIASCRGSGRALAGQVTQSRAFTGWRRTSERRARGAGRPGGVGIAWHR